MNPLDLTRICRLAPYKVWTEDGRDYYVETSRGQIFDIGFMDDYSIWPTGAYQFTINNQSHQPSPLDLKLRDTILLLIEAFFAANPDILLYICETGDGRQLTAFNIDFGDKTGIEEIDGPTSSPSPARPEGTLDPSRREGGLYRLDGTRVSGKPSARGLYINNGKKVVVK